MILHRHRTICNQVIYFVTECVVRREASRHGEYTDVAIVWANAGDICFALAIDFNMRKWTLALAVRLSTQAWVRRGSVMLGVRVSEQAWAIPSGSGTDSRPPAEGARPNASVGSSGVSGLGASSAAALLQMIINNFSEPKPRLNRCSIYKTKNIFCYNSTVPPKQTPWLHNKVTATGHGVAQYSGLTSARSGSAE